MKTYNKQESSNDAVYKADLSNNNVAKASQNKIDKMSEKEHKQSFNQLLDDAVLGIPKKSAD